MLHTACSPVLTYDWGIQANPELQKKLRNAWNNLGEEKQNSIKLAMYFGYPNTNISLSGNAAEKEIATQLVIWEFVCGYRSNDNYNLTDSRLKKALFGNNLDQNTGVYKAYTQIESTLKSFNTICSFFSTKKDSAPTKTMKWDGTKYTITLTDSNGVLSNFSLSCTNSDTSFQVSEKNKRLVMRASKRKSIF